MTYLLSVLWHFSVLKIIKFDKAVGFNFLSINHDLRSILDCYLTSFTVHQSANLFRAHRFFRSLLPTSVIRSLLVLQITVNIADGEIGSYCFPAGNQHYAKCDLWSVICDLWLWELNMAAWCWAHWKIDHVVHVNSSSSDFTALRGLLILKQQQQQQKTLVYQ